MELFEYQRPENIAKAAFSATSPGAMIYAGGTTAFDLMKLNIFKPSTLIDITRLPGLGEIEELPDAFRLGALVTMAQAQDHPILKRDYRLITESLYLGASQQLRNMATLGGNVLQKTRCPYYRDMAAGYACNKRSPGAGCAAMEGDTRLQAVLGWSSACNATFHSDFSTALAALDTSVTISDGLATRDVPFLALHLKPESTPHIETLLKAGEIITHITFKKTTLGRASVYLKVRDRFSYQFANASAAVALRMTGDVVSDVRIGIGGVATIPWRAFEAEAAIRGRSLTRETALVAGHAAFANAKAAGSNAFKLELGPRTIAKALLLARERA